MRILLRKGSARPNDELRPGAEAAKGVCSADPSCGLRMLECRDLRGHLPTATPRMGPRRTPSPPRADELVKFGGRPCSARGSHSAASGGLERLLDAAGQHQDRGEDEDDETESHRMVAIAETRGAKESISTLYENGNHSCLRSASTTCIRLRSRRARRWRGADEPGAAQRQRAVPGLESDPSQESHSGYHFANPIRKGVASRTPMRPPTTPRRAPSMTEIARHVLGQESDGSHRADFRRALAQSIASVLPRMSAMMTRMTRSPLERVEDGGGSLDELQAEGLLRLGMVS